MKSELAEQLAETPQRCLPAAISPNGRQREDPHPELARNALRAALSEFEHGGDDTMGPRDRRGQELPRGPRNWSF
jgi:hypothetical protein